METISANEAKVHFGELLIRAQRAPVQIRRNGKPVVVVLSNEDFVAAEEIRRQYVQDNIERGLADVETGQVSDGEHFLKDVLAGAHD